MRYLAILFLATMVACGGSPEKSGQKTFPTPEDAVVALVDAARAGNKAELSAIFGPEGEAILSSGDPVMDRNAVQTFVLAYDQRAQLSEENGKRVLLIGNEEWPFPIPVIKDGSSWRFNAEAGADEVLYRRIGRNELNTLEACGAYVVAQQEYAEKAHDGKKAGAYAQKFASAPGKQDGLYWPTEAPAESSPLGDLIAKAAALGYQSPGDTPVPFHGYYFRILTAQGKSAEGGARDYLKQGEMRGGFALIAVPAEYGNSGIMTFMVNQDGIIFQKDLGADTEKVAAAISAFDPDSTWSKAEK
jgi:hypothetical protein